MIGFLRGTLIAKRPPSLTLDVGGVGYELEAPMSTFYRLPDAGQPLSLVTHLVVREDAHVLFGFFTEAERALFRSLLKVSQRRAAHGARRAVGHERRRVLSVRARQGSREPHEDPRHRPQDRPSGCCWRWRIACPSRSAPTPRRCRRARRPEGEANGALLALGYKPGEVVRMLKDLDGARLSTEDMIREALEARASRAGRRPMSEVFSIEKGARGHAVRPPRTTKRSIAPCGRGGSPSTSASRA